MWFALRPVEIDFLASAPRRWAVEAQLRSPRQAVWDAFVDPSGWRHWFPGVREACYPGASPPYGVGTRRAAHVGSQRYEETILVWDEGVRWAYRIDRTTLPLSSAHVECTELKDHDRGTHLRWTLAAEPRLLMRLTSPFMPRMLDDLLQRAARNLDRHLSEA